MSQIVVGTWRVSYLSYKALFGWLTWTSYISNIVVRPLLMVSLFALLGRFVESSPKEIEAYILGMSCFWIGATLTSGIIQCFYYERVLGTLHLAMASPINRPYLYFSRAFAHLPNGLMSFVSAIVWAWVLLGLDLSNANWWALALSVAAILASTACFALFVANFAVVMREWISLSVVAHGFLMALTGVIVPIALLPWKIEYLSYALPLSHGLDPIRAAAGGGMVPYGNLVWEGLVALAYAILGYVMFHFMEIQMRRQGKMTEEA